LRAGGGGPRRAADGRRRGIGCDVRILRRRSSRQRLRDPGVVPDLEQQPDEHEDLLREDQRREGEPRFAAGRRVQNEPEDVEGGRRRRVEKEDAEQAQGAAESAAHAEEEPRHGRQVRSRHPDGPHGVGQNLDRRQGQQERGEPHRGHGEGGLLGVEIQDPVREGGAGLDEDPPVCGEGGGEGRQSEDQKRRHPAHAFATERHQRARRLAESAEHAPEGEGMGHQSQQDERERRGADALQAGQLRPAEALRRQQAGGHVREVPEQVGVRAAHGLPPAVVRVGDHAVGHGRAIELGVKRVADRQDQHRGDQELDEPERHGEVGLGQRHLEAAQEARQGPRAGTAHQATVMKSIMF
jgi:hypothetical protein